MASYCASYNNIHGKDAYISDMCPESQIGDFDERILRSLRIAIIRNLSIAALFAGCCATPLLPAEHLTPLDTNIAGVKCLERHEDKTKDGAQFLLSLARNPEVEFQGQSIHWL